MKSIINNIRNLEYQISVEIEKLKSKYDIGYLGLDLMNSRHAEYSFEARKVYSKLTTYLEGLSDDELYKLISLVYAGRDPQNVTDRGGFNEHYIVTKMHDVRGRKDCINAIGNKVGSLSNYLDAAQTNANAQGFNIDTDFN
ncbi:hypothetical protein [Vibrio parahaemolyticus]|uniref:hypothetical protein n=1 Tax=Vibrio parahaemolyticus TaxID=670 RepID=UPI00111F6DF8|nr:hypothetical protein [Vibrio parahaemolyticus]TOQ83751.1 hypothetical protein CGG87_23470 [Vibrio parahaemolyticus]